MNKILERQLKKVFGNLESVPKDLEALINLISETYNHFDEDRILVERSLEISSKELSDVNKKTLEDSNKLKVSFQELEKMNKMMIDRELKMIELKKEISELKKK